MATGEKFKPVEKENVESMKKLRNKNELRRKTFTTGEENVISLSLSRREKTEQFKLCRLQSEVSRDPVKDKVIDPTKRVQACVFVPEVYLKLV
jgi:hypothetical protein